MLANLGNTSKAKFVPIKSCVVHVVDFLAGLLLIHLRLRHHCEHAPSPVCVFAISVVG